ncbi:hypothetical protein FHG87_001796 [Trinorchestia longiramus]|nr:hypothetical protein FHG87_001796 [Trinorchestia longiramus]
MGTRAAAFTAKIRNLSEFQLRLVQGAVPPPSGVEIANILKYFNQLLLGVLRDIKSAPVEMLRHCDQDEARLTLFPSLDYFGLHTAVTNLLDLLQFVTFGKHALGTAILQLWSTLMIFLDRDTVDSMPFLVASMISTTPETVHPFLLKTLCFHVLPASVGATPKVNEEENYSAASVPAVIMLILQYTENSAYHCQLMECLMSVKCNVIHDLFCVIAHGTPGSRIPAANLLFYYWPNLNPKLFDRKGMPIKLSGENQIPLSMILLGVLQLQSVAMGLCQDFMITEVITGHVETA